MGSKAMFAVFIVVFMVGLCDSSTGVETCHASEFLCLSDNKCIETIKRCDSNIDCTNGEDEQNCGCKDYLAGCSRQSSAACNYKILLNLCPVQCGKCKGGRNTAISSSEYEEFDPAKKIVEYKITSDAYEAYFASAFGAYEYIKFSTSLYNDALPRTGDETTNLIATITIQYYPALSRHLGVGHSFVVLEYPGEPSKKCDTRQRSVHAGEFTQLQRKLPVEIQLDLDHEGYSSTINIKDNGNTKWYGWGLCKDQAQREDFFQEWEAKMKQVKKIKTSIEASFDIGMSFSHMSFSGITLRPTGTPQISLMQVPRIGSLINSEYRYLNKKKGQQ